MMVVHHEGALAPQKGGHPLVHLGRQDALHAGVQARALETAY